MKTTLSRYLQQARDAAVWKLEGLDEYDIRRPMVRTGTNLLGLVKHVASVESAYFGEVFGRPFPDPPPWTSDGAEPNADLWATAGESRDFVVDFYRRVQKHSDDTIASLPLDAIGFVGWWPEERRNPTLHAVLVHMIAETHRHAGHADILRELIDGSVGRSANGSEFEYEFDWEEHRARLEQAARDAAGGDSE